ncbi:hypothetical protein T10_8787 [Trichinella papuae]|uniref:TTF-type domain-containing protein n=1 Tax=Trichinella papuae TaxID=268474 RepID=A0A0V1M1N4_9BILA|nr:hypothetical protein T10_8787 [Trichinella papuae]
MDPNWKGMKSLMDFYAKSESNAETESNVLTDLGNESPQQPVHQKFPVTKFAGSSKSFCAGWYKKFKWLEYSLERDAAFCFPC